MSAIQGWYKRNRENLVSSAVLLLCSLMYILFELGFNTHLVDFLGTAPSKEEIHSIEELGRTLTGIALGLFFFAIALRLSINSYIKKYYLFSATISILIIPTIFILSIIFAKYAIEEFVEYATRNTSLEYRQNALIASFLVKEMHGDGTHSGLPLLLNSENIQEAYGAGAANRFFLASLPFALSQYPNLREKVLETVRRRIELRLVSGSEGSKGLGTPEAMFNNTYSPSIERLNTLYNNGFIPAADQYEEILARAPKIASDKWDNFRQEVERRTRMSLEQANQRPQIREKIVNEVVLELPQLAGKDKYGLPWYPTERERYLDAAEADVRKRAKSEYSEALIGMGFKGYIDPSPIRSFHSFLGRAEVHEVWEKGLIEYDAPKDLLDSLREFGPRFGASEKLFSEFKLKVYNRGLKKLADKEMSIFTEDMNQLVLDPKYEEKAYNATKSVILVPIALIFSLFGILAHVWKIGMLISKIAVGEKMYMINIIFATYILAGVVTIHVEKENPGILSQKYVTKILSNLNDEYNRFAKEIVATAMKLEATAYPYGQKVLAVKAYVYQKFRLRADPSHL